MFELLVADSGYAAELRQRRWTRRRDAIGRGIVQHDIGRHAALARLGRAVSADYFNPQLGHEFSRKSWPPSDTLWIVSADEIATGSFSGRNGSGGCEAAGFVFEAFSVRRERRTALRGADEAELLQGRDPIVEADFLKDSSILEFQHGRAGEFHLAARVSRQRSHQEVAERGPRMGSPAFPSADDVIAFRYQIRCAPEVEIGERLPEARHKRLDVFPAMARLVERILQEHVGCSEFIDNSKVASLAPKIREPPANNNLVIFFLRHDYFSCYLCLIAVRDQRTSSR
jgi:hypothetical protein